MHLSSILRLAFDVFVLDVVVVAVVFVVIAAFSSSSGGGALTAHYCSPRRMFMEGYFSQGTAEQASQGAPLPRQGSAGLSRAQQCVAGLSSA